MHSSSRVTSVGKQPLWPKADNPFSRGDRGQESWQNLEQEPKLVLRKQTMSDPPGVPPALSCDETAVWHQDVSDLQALLWLNSSSEFFQTFLHSEKRYLKIKIQITCRNSITFPRGKNESSDKVECFFTEETDETCLSITRSLPPGAVKISLRRLLK